MAAPELLSDEGFRADGRRATELRKIRVRMGLFAQADGSAYIEHGNTKAIAVVYGPHETRGARPKAPSERAVLRCRYSAAAFSGTERRRRPHGDRAAAEAALQLHSALHRAVICELLPRSHIDLHVRILQADGSNYSACINAATLAIIDAGIPLRDFVCASSAGLADEATLADLSYLEEAAGAPRATLAMLPSSGTISLVQLDARLHHERLEAVLDAAAAACRAVHAVMEEAVRERAREVTALLGE